MKKFHSRLLLLTAALCLLTSLPAPAADLSITAASVACSADGLKNRVTRTAGETIAPGQTVYLKSDNKFWLCDNNLSAAASKVYGISLNSATAGQPETVCYKDKAFTLGATLVIGDTLWTSGTAGGITKTVGDNVTGMFVSCLGVANSVTTFNLNITRADVVKP